MGQQLVKNVSKNLNLIFNKYRHKKVYSECHLRKVNIIWGSSDRIPNRVLWRFYYELKNDSTRQISLDYMIPNGKFEITGRLLKSGDYGKRIIAANEAKACLIIGQRIKEIRDVIKRSQT